MESSLGEEASSCTMSLMQGFMPSVVLLNDFSLAASTSNQLCPGLWDGDKNLGKKETSQWVELQDVTS